MRISRPIVKLASDKWHVKDWILSNFPQDYENMTYIEPYGGTFDLVFVKNKSKFEVVNDQNEELINIFRALRDEPSEFIKKVKGCKTTPEFFNKAHDKNLFEDYLDQAVNNFILRRISKNGEKEKYQKPSSPEAWKNGVKSLNTYAERISDVYLTNKKALEVINIFNTNDSFMYCDPPYLWENNAKCVYSSEMTPECHMELYQLLNNFKGKVIISGCLSPLYKRLYKNWNIEKKKVNNKKVQETEVIWKNF